MKKFIRLKMVLVIAALASSAAIMAVTLPSTSYTPFSSSEPSYQGISSGTFVKLPETSFQSLGASDWCTKETPGTESCEACCVDELRACLARAGEDPTLQAECATSNDACMTYCDGRSLPLDGGLGIMLILSVIGAAVRPLMCRKLS